MVTEMNDESANEALLRPVRSGNVFEETVNRLLQLDGARRNSPGMLIEVPHSGRVSL
jgi:hypothetical protein